MCAFTGINYAKRIRVGGRITIRGIHRRESRRPYRTAVYFGQPLPRFHRGLFSPAPSGSNGEACGLWRCWYGEGWVSCDPGLRSPRRSRMIGFRLSGDLAIPGLRIETWATRPRVPGLFSFAPSGSNGEARDFMAMVGCGELSAVLSHPSDKNKSVARVGHPADVLERY